MNIGSLILLQKREGVLFYGLAVIICVLICIPIVIKNKDKFFNQGLEKSNIFIAK